MFDQPSIEKLKSEFTDKYVVVDGGRPELARFNGLTGQIKTVNMSGKALVQFDGRLNIGWYDIGLDFLKIVPKPEPKVEEKKPAAAKPQTSADSPAVAPKPVGATAEKKPSVLDQLRAQGGAKAAAAPAAPAKEAAKPAPAAKPEPVAEKKPEAKPAEAAPAGEKKKLSTAEILAALKKKA
jgi:hypothetical protein